MQRANKIYQILVEMYPEVRCELNYQDHFQLLIAGYYPHKQPMLKSTK